MEKAKKILQRLTELRQVLVNEQNSTYLEFFDEFVQQDEWGSAFFAVCDYLLESTTTAPPAAVMENISALGKLMESEDPIVESLRRKAGN
jgi:hypothetical protein